MGLSQGWLELLMTCIDCTTYSAITSCTMSGSWQYLIISFLRYIPPKIGSQYFGHLYFYFLLFFPLFYSSPACSVFPYEEQLRPKAVTTICNLLQPHHPRSHPKKRYNSGSIKNTKKKKTSHLLSSLHNIFVFHPNNRYVLLPQAHMLDSYQRSFTASCREMITA